jgi:hypothetical protein
MAIEEKGSMHNYWSLDGQLYDLTPFVSSHPGGATILQKLQGKDCTEAFYAHHANPRNALATLASLKPVAPDPAPTFHTTSPLTVDFQKVIAELLPGSDWRGHDNRFIFASWLITVVHLIMLVMWPMCGSYALAMVSGVCTALQGGVGHHWLHSGDKYRWMFDLSGMCSSTWIAEHILCHHIDPNGEIDTSPRTHSPILTFHPKRRSCLQRRYPSLMVIIAFLLTGPALLCRIIIAIARTQYDDRYFALRLIPAFLPTAVVMGSGKADWIFALLGTLLSVTVAGTYFSVCVYVSHNQPECWNQNPRATFIERNITSTVDYGAHWGFWRSLPVLWLNHQTIHHLYPALCPSKLFTIESAIKVVCAEHNFPFQVKSAHVAMLDFLKFCGQKFD